MSTRMFVTKYWATTGLFEMRGELVHEIDSKEPKYFSGKHKSNPLFLKIGTDCFKEREDAVTYIQKAAVRKQASLEKQINKLQKVIDGEIKEAE